MIKKYFFYVTVVFLCMVFFLFNFLSLEQVEVFTIIYISSSLIYLLMVFILLKIKLGAKEIIGLVLIGIFVRLYFINFQPIGSDDIYRYVWDGKVQANGINPYSYAPNDTSLQKLHSNILPSLVKFPKIKTVYFPLSQWIFYIGYKISGENFWGYKILLFIFELLTIFSLFLILKKIRLPSKFILFYALCPLPIIHFAIDSHLDGFGLPLLLLTILFYFKDKKIISLIFLGLASSIKPIGFLLVPIFFLNEKNNIERLKVVTIPFFVFFLQFIPYIFTSNPFEAFLLYTKHWTYNGVVFDILNSFIDNNQTSRLICAILLIVTLTPLFLSKKDLLSKIYYSFLILFIYSPIVHPWYITWLAILLPIFPQWSGFAYISLSSLTSFTILNYQLNGVWKDYPLVLFFEYVPVLVLIILEIKKIVKIQE